MIQNEQKVSDGNQNLLHNSLIVSLTHLNKNEKQKKQKILEGVQINYYQKYEMMQYKIQTYMADDHEKVKYIIDKNINALRNSQHNLMNQHIKIGQYVIGQKIGSGGFSTVCKAYDSITGHLYAVKIISIKKLTYSQYQQLNSEIQISFMLTHPNVIKVHDTFKDSQFVYVFMEFVQGRELFNVIVEQGRLTQLRAVKIFYQLLRAIKYLHCQGIVHRDIKAQNIMIDQADNIKLIDFGLSKKCIATKDNCLKTFCGSPPYFAPEMLKRKGYNGKSIDIWCIGVILYFMIEGKMPFGNQTNQNMKYMILNNFWESSIYSSKEAIQIYQSIFVKDEVRITIKQLLSSSLIKKYTRRRQHLINSLDFKRGSFQHIFNHTLEKMQREKKHSRQTVKHSNNLQQNSIDKGRKKNKRITLRLLDQSKYCYEKNVKFEQIKRLKSSQNIDKSCRYANYQVQNQKLGFLTTKKIKQKQDCHQELYFSQNHQEKSINKKLSTLGDDKSMQKDHKKYKFLNDKLKNLKAVTERDRIFLRQAKIDVNYHFNA